MDHRDHVCLLHEGVPLKSGVWADFGSGSGAFTLALAELIGPKGVIYSIDKDSIALADQRQKFQLRYPETTVHFQVADYTRRISLPALDGLVMANALHFQPKKKAVVQLLQSYLKPHGSFILIEYDTDWGNRWVPYPLSYEAWVTLAQECGFQSTRRLATVPSSFLGQFYSALSTNAP